MSEKISLSKRSDAVKISLKKQGVRDKVTLRVALALDKSGSAEPFYRNGQFEELVDRLLPVADNFDDNSTIDSWLFHNSYMRVEDATPENYGSYIKNVIMKGQYANEWGGTKYAPVMKAIHNFYFGIDNSVQTKEVRAKGIAGLFGKKEVVEQRVIKPSEDGLPALVLFITDGENNDQRETLEFLESVKNSPVYWMTVGVGNSSFRSLEQIADKFDNVGFISFPSLAISDEVMYDKILNGELAEWINKH